MSETINTQTTNTTNTKLIDIVGLNTFWGKAKEYIQDAINTSGGGGNISGDFATDEDIDEVCTYNYNGNKVYLSKDLYADTPIIFSQSDEPYIGDTKFETKTSEDGDAILTLKITPDELGVSEPNCPCNAFILSSKAYNPTKSFSINFNIHSEAIQPGDMGDTQVVFIPTSQLKGYMNDGNEYDRFDIDFDFDHTSGIICMNISKDSIGNSIDKEGNITYNFDEISGLDEYSNYFIGFRTYRDDNTGNDIITIKNVKIYHSGVVEKELSELITTINNNAL